MNRKYELLMQYIKPFESHVNVTVAVVYTQLPNMPVYSLDVSIDRDGTSSLAFYEAEALKKAMAKIHDIANDLKEAAS